MRPCARPRTDRLAESRLALDESYLRESVPDRPLWNAPVPPPSGATTTAPGIGAGILDISTIDPPSRILRHHTSSRIPAPETNVHRLAHRADVRVRSISRRRWHRRPALLKM